MSASGRLPFIKALSPDLDGWSFYLCAQKDARQGRGGDTFIALTLQDRTGVLKGRIAQDVARLREEFDAGDFVKIQGRTESFNGRTQLIVDRIRRVNPDQDRAQGFREEDCVLSSARPAEEMWAELQELIAHVPRGSVEDVDLAARAAAKAFDSWSSALAKAEAAEGKTGGKVAIGAPVRETIVGDRAYVVTPSTYTFKQKGQTMREAGTLTIVLIKGKAGWKIQAWAWTSPEAAPLK